MEHEQDAAPEADVIQLLSNSASKLAKSASMGATAFHQYDRQPAFQSTTLPRLPSGKHGMRTGTSARIKPSDSNYGSPDSLHSPVVGSGMSTSKASRYLQKHGVSSPAAVQQMQTLQQQDGPTQAAGVGFSLADSCSSMAGMSQQPMQQLLIPAQRVAMVPHQHIGMPPDNVAANAADLHQVAQGMQQVSQTVCTVLLLSLLPFCCAAYPGNGLYGWLSNFPVPPSLHLNCAIHLKQTAESIAARQTLQGTFACFPGRH